MFLIFSLSRCSLKKRGELHSDYFGFFFVALFFEKSASLPGAKRRGNFPSERIKPRRCEERSDVAISMRWGVTFKIAQSLRR
jgi:hypothetical protein